jgi:hypothetical protein
MSLHNVKLPDFVIADLYRQSLIQYDGVVTRPSAPSVAESQPLIKPQAAAPAPPAETKASASESAYKILGNNTKHISIIVHFTNEVFLPEADLQFLAKMLGACKLNMGDVAIVNHATAEVVIDKLKQQLQPKYVLLFGVEPGAIQLPISFPPFKEQPYAGCTYLFTPPLSQLNQENDDAKQLKRKLWDCLKRIFL